MLGFGGCWGFCRGAAMGDVRGIVVAIEHPDACSDDFDASGAQPTTRIERAGIIWRKFGGPDVPVRVTSDRAKSKM